MICPSRWRVVHFASSGSYRDRVPHRGESSKMFLEIEMNEHSIQCEMTEKRMPTVFNSQINSDIETIPKIPEKIGEFEGVFQFLVYLPSEYISIIIFLKNLFLTRAAEDTRNYCI